jgi:geranylgeranyl diphosphate synthase type II
MTSFQEYLIQVKPIVDARIGEVASRKLKDDYLVRLLMRGKRLRAGLLSLVFESTSGKSLNGTVDLACAVELAHSASLIIDDMLDEDETRRGMPTVHMTEGQKRAMLDTVGILSLPYDLVVPYGEWFVQSLAETQRGMVSGVLKEVLQDPELPASKIYDLIIRQKTGEPFGLAASWGYLAGLNGKKNGVNGHLQKWTTYGIHVGKAMQIADDIADLEEVMKTRKKTGFGSELLLLRCVTAERLAKELFSDIRRMTLHFEKARELWSREGIQESLRVKLQKEITAAQDVVLDIRLPRSANKDLLIAAPKDIAQIMLAEAKLD